jgi:hypothetical protein
MVWKEGICALTRIYNGLPTRKPRMSKRARAGGTCCGGANG